MTIRQILKYLIKKFLPTKVVNALHALRRLPGSGFQPEVPFDNTYPWLNYTFSDLIKDAGCARKPMYVWGVAQGAALAKVLGISRISVLEFGVAGGSGLLALESVAEAIEDRTNVIIDVFGFDTGIGLPEPEDFRDQPNMWFAGQLPMDREKLEAALNRAQLRLGPVKETVPTFVAEHPAPVAFVSIDLDLYSSTRDALRLFESDYNYLLPRVTSYFDDIFGHAYNDFCGERLAILEFNNANLKRKICPNHGLRYFVPRIASADLWPDCIYLAHFFDHPLYNSLDSINKAVFAHMNGTIMSRSVRSTSK